MKAEIIMVDGLSMVGRAESNHWVPMDGDEKYGGHEAGVKPMEMVLIALGACTGMDVISILRKMQVRLRKFKVEVEAERAKEHPKVFTKVHMKYVFGGENIPRDKVERAIELSQTKYCPVLAMLRKVAEITYEYEIVDE